MRGKLEAAMAWLEKLASIITVVVPAARTIVSLVDTSKTDDSNR